MVRSNIIRWKVKEPFDPSRGLIRMSWNKYNLYSLATRTRPDDLTRKSVFQQKWAAKRELRAYHVPNISERQLTQRHWSVKLPLQQLTQDEKDRLPPVQALAFAETERRLDVVVFRSHFASSLWMARASVVQGHVMVNGEKCTLPARRLADGDLVTVSPAVVPTLSPPESTHEAPAEGAEAAPAASTDLASPAAAPKAARSPLKFTAVPYQAPWMFIPAYLEVDYATCSTVFLRSPLPQPDQVEVPSPFPPEWHQLAYEWYSEIVKKKQSIRTNFELKPKPVVEGVPIKMKQKFAEIRERDVKAARDLRSAARREAEQKKAEARA